MPVYLDYNATAPVRPEAAARMQEILAVPANASSVHSYGRAAKKHLENARKTIADAISVFPAEIIFTASGTEANAMALRGFAGRRVLVSAVEHSSILSSLRAQRSNPESKNWIASSPTAPRNDVIPVDRNGIIDLESLDCLLANSEPALVSVMLANNETGVIQPINEVAAICKKYGALLHCDAVQGLGKIPVDFGLLSCDAMTISAHKCGGPVGAAALVVKQDLAIMPLLTGGGQELGRRAGTENIAAIAGFAKAVELFDFAQMERLRGWMGTMESVLMSATNDLKDSSPSAQNDNSILGRTVSRLPNTSCIAMPGVSSEVQLMDFDLKGFAISAGSACSSGRIEPSHVLKAMGVDDALAKCAIRISGGWNTTEKEIQDFTAAWLALAGRLRKR